jgi:hypothetical protein
LLSETVPRIVEPSFTVTVPVGAIPPDGVTTAVNEMLRPYVEGFTEDVTFVVVEDFTIVNALL